MTILIKSLAGGRKRGLAQSLRGNRAPTVPQKTQDWTKKNRTETKFLRQSHGLSTVVVRLPLAACAVGLPVKSHGY